MYLLGSCPAEEAISSRNRDMSDERSLGLPKKASRVNLKSLGILQVAQHAAVRIEGIFLA